MDLKLLGEIYTKGSWGLSAASNYRKRYKYSGSFFSYQDTKNGDKGNCKTLQEQETVLQQLQWSYERNSNTARQTHTVRFRQV